MQSLRNDHNCAPNESASAANHLCRNLAAEVEKKELKDWQKSPYTLFNQQPRCFVVQLDWLGHVDRMDSVDGRRHLVWENAES